jgi:hypothetical protein
MGTAHIRLNYINPANDSCRNNGYSVDAPQLLYRFEATHLPRPLTPAIFPPLAAQQPETPPATSA